jgi:hypothetical protein
MDDFIRIFAERGDLAHLALLLWATTASALALMALRELFASIRRFDDFVRELARFNDTFHGPCGELSLVECPAFALTLLHALWLGHESGINGFASLSALLMTYFAARFGVLGVYVSGRTREKQASATGQLPPSLINEALRALAKRK